MNLTNTTVSQYQITERIGQGGMATVYKAYQPSLDRFVALKILAADLAKSEDFVTRFEREARTIARLRHRNILTIFDYGRQDDFLYLAMEYVEGGTLKDRLGWPQSFAYAVDITTQIGQALAHAHHLGIIHRDIKPANVLVGPDNWLLLSDFGLVKLVEDSLQLTISGASLGTPQYMSPEQAQGGEVDRRSDIYSLGVVLYEAITGQPPFAPDNPVAVIMKHISDPVPPPHLLRSDLPPELERVILKALAKSPVDRYQQVETFLDELHEAYPISTYPGRMPRDRTPTDTHEYAIYTTSVSPSTLPGPRRRWPWTGLIITILLLLIAGLGVMIWLSDESMTVLASVLNEAVPASTPTPAATATPTPTLAGVPVESGSAATEFTPSTVPPSPAPVETATPTPATPPPVETRISEKDGAELVRVPAGEFIMGSDTLGNDELPVHSVYLDEFWIDRYEVTNAQFAQFIDETGYQTEAERRGWGWVYSGQDWEETQGANWRSPQGPGSDLAGKSNYPVVLVSWNDAAAYCEWAGRRLPTEAEWEKAARGDAATEQFYPWGETFDPAKANTKETNRNSATPVGAFSPQGDSRYGAADMSGNVWEWVADWYDSDYYSQTPGRNPPGPASGNDKVLRGGSWLYDALYARTAFRYNIPPDYTYDFTGFRCSSR